VVLNCSLDVGHYVHGLDHFFVLLVDGAGAWSFGEGAVGGVGLDFLTVWLR
jgi:hypothetical protein